MRLESGYVYAIPVDDTASPEESVPSPAGECQARSDFPNLFSIPPEKLPLFREIVQDWSIDRIEREYLKAGGASTRGKQTGAMARVILGLSEWQDLTPPWEARDENGRGGVEVTRGAERPTAQDAVSSMALDQGGRFEPGPRQQLTLV